MIRKWKTTIDGKEYHIEADYGAFVQDAEETQEVLFQKDGNLAVNGGVIKTWKEELPKEIIFEVGGKPAAVRKKGLFNKQLELFINGQQIKPLPNE
jgi:hypothetical protein